MDVRQMKNYFILIVKLCFAALILGFLVHYSQLKFSLFSSFVVHPFHSIWVVWLFYFMLALGITRWYRLNQTQNILLSFNETAAFTYFCVAFNNVLPGNVGGDVIRLFHTIKKFSDKKTNIILSAFFDRLSGLMGIIAVICCAGLMQWPVLRSNPQLLHTLKWCIGIALGVVVGLSIVFAFSRAPFKRLQPILDALNLYRDAKKVMLESLFISIGIQFLMILAVINISKIMGIAPISPLDYAIAMGIAQIANLIPLTPGGLGIGEMVFSNILLLLNPNSTAAFATVFLGFRLFCSLSYLPGVLMYILNFKLSFPSGLAEQNKTLN